MEAPKARHAFITKTYFAVFERYVLRRTERYAFLTFDAISRNRKSLANQMPICFVFEIGFLFGAFVFWNMVVLVFDSGKDIRYLFIRTIQRHIFVKRRWRHHESVVFGHFHRVYALDVEIKLCCVVEKESVRSRHHTAVVLYNENLRVFVQSRQKIEYGQWHAKRVYGRHDDDFVKLIAISAIRWNIQNRTAKSFFDLFGNV